MIRINETKRNDTLVANQADSYHMYGEQGDDTLTGGVLDDWLFGGEGNDTLNGGRGNDLLDGGAGADWLIGGIGEDTARYVELTKGVMVDPRHWSWIGRRRRGRYADRHRGCFWQRVQRHAHR